MSDAAGRLAKALRDLINEGVEARFGQGPPAPAAVEVVERPRGSGEDFELCPRCRTNHMRRLLTAKEARQQLGGISPTTFYAPVKAGELSLVKIGRRSFVQSEALADFVRRKATSS